MSQLTDFLMIGMIGVGGIFIFFNWDQVEALLKGGGQAVQGNCTKHADGQANKYCWNGTHTTCTNGKNVVDSSGVCITCTDPTNESACCNAAASQFTTTFPNKPCTSGGNCGGGYVKSGSVCLCNPTVKPCQAGSGLFITNTSCQCKVCSTGTCPSGYHGVPAPGGVGCNCVKNTGGGGCTKGYAPCSGGCCCNPVAKGCTSGQIVGLLNGICSCQNCPTGTKRGGTSGNSCVPISGGNVTICGAQANGAQAWIARTANAILGRMCGCTKVPSITQILQGWPSLTQQCAVENNCNTNKLHSSNATFNKHYAQLLIAIRNAYSVPITVNAANALAVQQGNGVWWLAPWDSNIVGYYTKAMASGIRGDTPAGPAYAPTLQGRKNAYDPYGDQRYSFTLPENMKVKVSN